MQRYATSIVGGAESHARQVAERLVSDRGWEVHVYTTTASNYRTWKRHYKAGREQLNGVIVHRFNVAFPRWMPVFDLLTRLLTMTGGRAASDRPGPVRQLLEYLWLILQGPFCPGLIRALKRDGPGFQRIFFFTYLYYPTVVGLPQLAERAALIPTAHDEAPFHWTICRRSFAEAQVILPSTRAELDLIRKHLPADSQATFLQAGIGLDFEPGPQRLGCSSLSDGQPLPPRFVLYLGRICRGKGVDQLIRDFASYVHGGHEDVTLVLAGALEGDVDLPSDTRIRYLGFVNDSDKDLLIQRCSCLINPSPHESLSMVVLEALAHRVPVLVNGHCEVLRCYADELPTVTSYFDPDSFADELQRVLHVDWHAQMAAALDESQHWAERHFGWDKLLDVYDQALAPAP